MFYSTYIIDKAVRLNFFLLAMSLCAVCNFAFDNSRFIQANDDIMILLNPTSKYTLRRSEL